MSNVKIYTAGRCSYCDWSKQLLNDKEVSYTEVRVDVDAEAREALIEKTGRTSVPQIFIGETHIGGYEELVAINEKGDLDNLLAEK